MLTKSEFGTILKQIGSNLDELQALASCCGRARAGRPAARRAAVACRRGGAARPWGGSWLAGGAARPGGRATRLAEGLNRVAGPGGAARPGGGATQPGGGAVRPAAGHRQEPEVEEEQGKKLFLCGPHTNMPFCSFVLSIYSAPRIFSLQTMDTGRTELADAVSKMGGLLELLSAGINGPLP
jgi:hypothetical protein